MRRVSFFLMILLLLMVSSAGCAGLLKGGGAIRPDANVTRTFESFKMNPNYHYYYTGSDVYPNALIGLDKKYALEPDLWKKMTPSPQLFRDLISQMQTRALNIGQTQHGFSILDDRGRQIGVWYSILGATTSVKMMDDKTVLIYQPPLNTYEKYEEERVRVQPHQ